MRASLLLLISLAALAAGCATPDEATGPDVGPGDACPDDLQENRTKGTAETAP